MRVLLLNRFFWPDEAATAMLAADVAQALATAGHEVHVACSRHRYDRPGERLSRHERWGTVQVHRLWSTACGGRSGAGRLLDTATFHLALRWWGLRAPRPDVTLAMTDPPLLLATAAFIRRRRGGRLVHFAADLYPDLAVALGALREGSPVTRWLARQSQHALIGCDTVLALGERMRQRLVEQGVPAGRLLVTPPWAVQRPGHDEARGPNRVRRELGLGEGDCAVMYAGTMGRCHPHATLLGAMKALAGEPRLHWLFVGGGSSMEELHRRVEGLGLTATRFLPYQPRERLAELLAAADLHLVVQDERTEGLCLPSKLAGVLAAGRPLLFVGADQAEIASTVRRLGCGVTIREGDGTALAAAIRTLAADPERRRLLGERGRTACARELSPERVLPRIVAAVEGRQLGAAPSTE